MEMKFPLIGSLHVRQQNLDNLEKFLYNLDLEHDYEALITEAKQDHSSKQRRLYRRWVGIWARTTHEQPVEVEGYSKLEVLLPLFEGWARHEVKAAQFRWLIKRFPRYEHRIFLAPSHLHTSDMNKAEYDEFLKKFQIIGAEQGVDLEDPEEILKKTFGKTISIGKDNLG